MKFNISFWKVRVFVFFVLAIQVFLLRVAAEQPLDLLELEVRQAQEDLGALEKSSLPADTKAEAVQKARAKVQLLTERNSHFRFRISDHNEFYHIYAADHTTAHQYLHEANQVYSNYRSLFTDYRFSNQYPAHFIVYPDRAAYMKYEGMSSMVVGHAFSQRLTFRKYVETDEGIKIEEEKIPNSKLQRLAFYVAGDDDPNQVTFAHEFTHLFNWDLINQDGSGIEERTPNLFLNEGLAEYFATLNNQEQQEMRLAPLRRIANPIGPWKWLEFGAYPSSAGRMREFYSEAHLFAAWLVGQKPAAGKRLKALLMVHSFDEAEGAMQRLTAEFVPRIDLNAYLTYRQKVLDAE